MSAVVKTIESKVYDVTCIQALMDGPTSPSVDEVVVKIRQSRDAR